MGQKDYRQYRDGFFEGAAKLGEKVPAVMQAFGQLHQASVAEGALSVKQKELIAVGIAVAIRCDTCIAVHVHDALKAGATPEEIAETVGVAIAMGGGPAAAFGVAAMRAVEAFQQG